MSPVTAELENLIDFFFQLKFCAPIIDSATELLIKKTNEMI